MKGWENWDYSAWRKGGMYIYTPVYINTCREGAKRMQPSSFQLCLLTGPEIMGTNWNTGGSFWTAWSSFSPWEWLSTGTELLTDTVKSWSPWNNHVQVTLLRQETWTRWPQEGCEIVYDQLWLSWEKELKSFYRLSLDWSLQGLATQIGGGRRKDESKINCRASVAVLCNRFVTQTASFTGHFSSLAV